MKKLTEWHIFSFFPKHCAYCDKLIAADRLMCSECEHSLPRITGEICTSCGREKKKCSCKKSANYFNGIVSPFYYSGNVRLGLRNFKFRSTESSGKAYAEEMVKTIRSRYKDIDFDYITEVPASKDSLRKRGFNQCSLLSEEISRLTGIPYKPGILKKIYETETQHAMSYYMRRGNLTGVFDSSVPEEIKGKTILLVDDISTSGETINECSKMLWLYDAEEIWCITAALTEKLR